MFYPRNRFVFEDGIQQQLNAFRTGFNQVFDMSRLQLFTAEEVGACVHAMMTAPITLAVVAAKVSLLLCGEHEPKWDRDDLITYTEPKFGFTRESPTFLHFVNVLLSFNSDQRKVI